jgi:putative transcriptional regulator
MARARKKSAVRDEEDASAFLAGRMLIAMPGIGDPRFDRAVILMCAHSVEQAMGITVNRPFEGLPASELFERLGMKSTIRLGDFPVLAGGPLERERGFVIHTDDYSTPESTLAVGDGVSLTATREILEAMGDEARRPRCAALALGCASWGSGQLEEELKENVWLACDADEALIFDDDHETKWARALAKLGVAPERLSMQAGRA